MVGEGGRPPRRLFRFSKAESLLICYMKVIVFVSTIYYGIVISPTY